MKKDVLNYEMSGDGIGVYCGTYRKYNEGSLYGMWIDFAECSDADEFFDVCRKLHDDEEDPEFMFQDFMGFPKSLYSESMGHEQVEKIIEYANMDDDDKEMLDDYIECYGGRVADLDLDKVRDKCIASGYNSLREYTDTEADEMMDNYESMCEHSYSCKGAREIVDNMRRYFDYESYYRDQKMYLSIGSNGYIFAD